LQVSAVDKASGNKNNITITNDKGRFSKEDIEQMVKEAEKYKEEDMKNRERIDAKNELEGYLYNIKSSVLDKDDVKIESADKDRARETVEDAMKWLDLNASTAEKTEFESKKEEVSKVLTPIMTKMYGNPTPANDDGVHVDEVD
jgi:molecular chaperone DnaK (HSP70)